MRPQCTVHTTAPLATLFSFNVHGAEKKYWINDLPKPKLLTITGTYRDPVMKCP